MLPLVLEALGGGLRGVLTARAAHVSEIDEKTCSLTPLGSPKWEHFWHMLRQSRGHLQQFGDRFVASILFGSGAIFMSFFIIFS